MRAMRRRCLVRRCPHECPICAMKGPLGPMNAPFRSWIPALGKKQHHPENVASPLCKAQTLRWHFEVVVAPVLERQSNVAAGFWPCPYPDFRRDPRRLPAGESGLLATKQGVFLVKSPPAGTSGWPSMMAQPRTRYRSAVGPEPYVPAGRWRRYLENDLCLRLLK